VGADAFASDLNPIPVLINKVVLEYIPMYGQRLADEVRKWGEWIKCEAEKELAEFYPKDSDGATPIAYLWARTILSEAPGGGDIALEVPLMKSLWLAKKSGRYRALRWVRDQKGKVQTRIVKVSYADGVTRKVRRPIFEIFEPASINDVETGTVARGHVTCPVTGYTTKVERVRAQLKTRRGGSYDALMFCVVVTHPNTDGRSYRLPTARDEGSARSASMTLAERIKAHKGKSPSLVPDEVISLNELRRISVPIYGIETWGDLFTPRQALALTTLARLVNDVGSILAEERNAVSSTSVETTSKGLAYAVQTCLAFFP
jgi:adenine-specific DNA methylase